MRPTPQPVARRRRVGALGVRIERGDRQTAARAASWQGWTFHRWRRRWPRAAI